MEEWKEYKLGDFVTVKGGKRLPKGINLISTKNSHPYIRIRDLGKSKYIQLNSDYEYVDDETQKSISRYITNKGDILLSIVGTIGLTGIVGESLDNANLTENCVKLIDLKNVDRNYLYYFLNSEIGQNEIKKGTVGAVQPKLPIKNIQAISISLPALPTQQKIAAILSSLDDKIELNNKINENLEQQAQALFKSFSEKSSESVKFTDLIDILGGGTPKTNNEDYWNGNIPFFTPKDVGNPYCLTTEKTITEDGLNNCNSKLYPVNTIFVTARGTVGKVCLAGVPMAMNQSCYALKSKDNNQLLAYYYTLEAISSLKHKANGATFDAIVTRDFETETISVLSQSDSEKFTQFAESVYEQILVNQQENLQLSQLRDTLLPKLMNGEIRL